MFTILIVFTDNSTESFECSRLGTAKDGIIEITLVDCTIVLSIANIRYIRNYCTYGLTSAF